MKALETRTKAAIRFVGTWTDADITHMVAFAQRLEPMLTRRSQVIPEDKPWTMICHASFDPVIYLASRIGVPGVFRAHTPGDLRAVIQSYVDENRRNGQMQR